MGVAITLLSEMFDYVGFTERDSALLLEMAPVVEPKLHPIVDRFYDAIQKNPGASSVITGGQAQIERLKRTLRQWLAGIVGGVYDEAYLERRARIGRMHVKIELDQRYMFGAMNILRSGLHYALEDVDWTSDKKFEGHRAIDRICDVELSIMLETYREDYIARMRNTERLATLGQLAASIGHELRNPLAVIETSLHLLKRRIGEDERAERHIRRITEQVTMSSAIISDLLALARDRPPARAATRIATVVREAVGLVPARDGITLVEDIPGDLPDVYIDPGQLRQLATNLIMNAVQAITTATDGPKSVWIRARVDEDGTLRLEVEDEGPGISKEAQKHLFEPLFTTRAKGFGLGLSLCRRIVEKHDGRIDAENRAEGGARFRIAIPHATEAPTPERKDNP